MARPNSVRVKCYRCDWQGMRAADSEVKTCPVCRAPVVRRPPPFEDRRIEKAKRQLSVYDGGEK